MSEANPNQSVFLVVDRAGNHHRVTADRMLTEGREVTFTVVGREVGSFFDPLSAKVSAPDDAPVAASRPGPPPPPPPMRRAGSTPAQRVVSLGLLMMLGGLLFFAAGFKAAGGVLLG